MSTAISLSQYVKKRTGVALGASGSMRNMLERSLGAPSFYGVIGIQFGATIYRAL